MTKIFKILFLLGVSLFNAQDNNDDKVLAKIGDKQITVEEFKIRYELTPQINRVGMKDALQKKEFFLHSLIAEKLWSLEAESFNLDTSEVMRYSFPALEKMYLRDALYNKEVKSKANPEKADIEKSIARMQYDVLVRFFYTQTKDSIELIYDDLLAGVQFDSLFASDPSNVENYYRVEFGQMEELTEDSIYSLTVGEFTSPIKSPAGWYIFYLDGFQPNSDFATLNDVSRNSKLRKVIDQRTLSKSNNEYYNSFFRNLNVKTDSALFWSFADKVSTILNSRASEAETDGVKLMLNQKDLQAMEESFGYDSLNMPFIKFEDRPVILKKFLHDFFFEGFNATFTAPHIISAQLQSRVKYFIERELLSRESVKQGLQNDPEVIQFLNIWRDNYMGTLYKRELLKGIIVSDNEVIEYYNANNNSTIVPKMVNIVEILSDSLEVIEKVLHQLDDGKALSELAPLYTKRIWTRDKGGEFGFFPVTAYGEIGRLAAEMEIGDLMGPVETPDGYSIFRLIDKEEERQSDVKPFDEIKDELKTQIRVQKLRNYFIDKTAELAAKYNVTIDSNLLSSIKVKDLSMFVYRYFGFGGRLPAVPVTNPFVEWIDKWKQNRKELP